MTSTTLTHEWNWQQWRAKTAIQRTSDSGVFTSKSLYLIKHFGIITMKKFFLSLFVRLYISFCRYVYSCLRYTFFFSFLFFLKKPLIKYNFRWCEIDLIFHSGYKFNWQNVVCVCWQQMIWLILEHEHIYCLSSIIRRFRLTARKCLLFFFYCCCYCFIVLLTKTRIKLKIE